MKKTHLIFLTVLFVVLSNNTFGQTEDQKTFVRASFFLPSISIEQAVGANLSILLGGGVGVKAANIL